MSARTVTAVRSRPEGVGDADIAVALDEGWGIAATSIEYAPVGGGSYHWVVVDHEHDRWFVTATDLDRSPWLGDTRAAAFDRLDTAMRASLALRTDAGLPFVVAPVPAADGATARQLNGRYALALHPYVDGWSGQFEDRLALPDQLAVVEVVAALHSCPSTVTAVEPHELAVDDCRMIATALDQIDNDRYADPTAARTRARLERCQPELRRAVHTFDRLRERCLGGRRPLVITHGEPHPGNVMHVGEELLLIDWDTVGLALPERDLWMLAVHGSEASRHYTELTGRPVDPAALALYSLDWRLQEVAGHLKDLGSEEGAREEERSWSALEIALTKLCSIRLPAA